jgi:hypothetical protein
MSPVRRFDMSACRSARARRRTLLPRIPRADVRGVETGRLALTGPGPRPRPRAVGHSVESRARPRSHPRPPTTRAHSPSERPRRPEVAGVLAHHDKRRAAIEHALPTTWPRPLTTRKRRCAVDDGSHGRIVEELAAALGGHRVGRLECRMMQPEGGCVLSGPPPGDTFLVQTLHELPCVGEPPQPHTLVFDHQDLHVIFAPRLIRRAVEREQRTTSRGSSDSTDEPNHRVTQSARVRGTAVTFPRHVASCVIPRQGSMPPRTSGPADDRAADGRLVGALSRGWSSHGVGGGRIVRKTAQRGRSGQVRRIRAARAARRRQRGESWARSFNDW